MHNSFMPAPQLLMNQRQVRFGNVLTLVMQQLTKTKMKLFPTELQMLPGPVKDHKYVLYAHVPFCETLCPYCSFNRFVFNEKRTVNYFKNLRQEMRMVSDLGYKFESLYVGGGTPTIIVEELVETIELAKQLFDINEVSCETNPNHLTPEVLNQLKGRVDRLSVGVQSFDDGLLKQMSRYNRFGSGQEILEKIQNSVGILPSLNVDMIFNFPSQTEDILRKDIEMIIASGADQTTFYPLMSSPSVEKSLVKSVGKVDYQREAGFYQIIQEELGKEFTARSAWTYSRGRSTLIDEYIVQYEEYLAVGSGSFSYLGGKLFVNTFSVNEYNDFIQSGRMSVNATHQFSKKDRMLYRFMMELFDLKLNKKRFKEDFNVSVKAGLWLEYLFMNIAGAFEKGKDEYLHLSPKNRYLLVVMMREFFSGVNNVRDQARGNLSPQERLMCTVNEQSL